MSKKEEKVKENKISLNFAVTGKPITVDNVNVNQPLKVAVQEALKKTGSSRSIDEYDVLMDSKRLDISKKVKEFNFVDKSVVFVSLKTGKGGK